MSIHVKLNQISYYPPRKNGDKHYYVYNFDLCAVRESAALQIVIRAETEQIAHVNKFGNKHRVVLKSRFEIKIGEGKGGAGVAASGAVEVGQQVEYAGDT